MLEADAATRYGFEKVTGQGDAVFSWDERLTAAMPAEAKKYEKDLHGGFAEDAKTNKVYTGIPGVGLFEISPDLTTWRKIGSDGRLLDNIHGLTVFEHDGRTTLALAQNDAQRVLLVGLDGNVQQELSRPRGGEFAHDEANAYYSERRASSAPKIFCCTDVCYLDGKLYVATGYSEGDFVLTASPASSKSTTTWAWGGGGASGEGVAWGGKGDRGGQFRTAHGIFAHGGHVYVANREAYQVIKFTKHGQLVEVLPEIPVGARICNVAYAERHAFFVMNALAPLGGAGGLPSTPNRTAPIYVHSGAELLSTVDAGALGIPVSERTRSGVGSGCAHVGCQALSGSLPTLLTPHCRTPHASRLSRSHTPLASLISPVSQVLKHIHHVHPHYDPHGVLYLLVHGWRDGKFAVLKHEPTA